MQVCESIRIRYLVLKKKKFTTLIICKNVVKNFVAITLLLKEWIVLLKGQSIILFNKIAKISTY